MRFRVLVGLLAIFLWFCNPIALSESHKINPVGAGLVLGGIPSVFGNQTLMPAAVYVHRAFSATTYSQLTLVRALVFINLFSTNGQFPFLQKSFAQNTPQAVQSIQLEEATWGLEDFWKDVDDVPPAVKEKLRRLALQERWNPMLFLNNPHFFTAINKDLLANHIFFIVQAGSSAKPQLSKAAIGLRVAVLHLSPMNERRTLNTGAIIFHQVIRMSGYTSFTYGRAGYTPAELPSDVFWFKDAVDLYEERLIVMRKYHDSVAAARSTSQQNKIKKRALVEMDPLIIIKDPIAYNIIDRTFASTPENKLADMIKEMIEDHEMIHSWLISIAQALPDDEKPGAAEQEKAAYVGEIIFSAHPRFNLLRQASLIFANELTRKKIPWNRRPSLSSTEEGIKHGMWQLADALATEGLLPQERVKNITDASTAKLMSSENMIALLYLFDEFHISDQQLRDMANTVLTREFGGIGVELSAALLAERRVSPQRLGLSHPVNTAA